MIRKNFKFFLIFLFIAFALNYIFFYRLKDGQFLFIGDQFFRFSYAETATNSFFIRKIENLGVHNGWQLMVQFWDVLYYLLIYNLNFSLFSAEKILFFLVLFISLCLSFIGFQKVGSIIDMNIRTRPSGSRSLFISKFEKFRNNKNKGINIFVITLWYCFNPYTMSLWHGGVYNLGSSLTYSLAPLIFYYFHKSIFSDFKLKNRTSALALRTRAPYLFWNFSNSKIIIICSILLFIASFTFWLFAAFAFFLIMYFFFHVLFNKFNKKLILNLLKNGLTMILIYGLLISFLAFNILYEYYNNAGDNNGSFWASYVNQRGGIWYQLLLLFSWGIYIKWVPRSIYSFSDYYFSAQYIIATLCIYLIIFMVIIKKYWKIVFAKLIANNELLFGFSPGQKIKGNVLNHNLFLASKDKLLIIFLLLLAVSLFFAKASQPPFGGIFVFLFEHFPFFSVFRSADIRFGFSVVLALALLLLYVSNQYNKRFFFIAILIIMLFQNLLFFNGTAIYGENKNNSFYDRIIYIPNTYQEVANFLNKDKGGSGYVLPIPAVEYGHYILDEQEHHIGQDLLSKLINRPFANSSLSSGMFGKSYNELNEIVKSQEYGKDYNLIRKFPIKYVILRKDINDANETDLSFSEKELKDEFELVFQNKLFTVYKAEGYSPIINSENANFKIINPVKYEVQLNNIKNRQDLNFMLSFDKNWKLYISRYNEKFGCNQEKNFEYSKVKECVEEQKFFEGEELSYMWRGPIFDETHSLVNGYANGWVVDPEYIKAHYSSEYYKENPEAGIDIELVIYYKPQSYFYFSSIVSGMTFLGCLIYLGYDWRFRKKKLLSKPTIEGNHNNI